jgi:hypothetical protein
MENKTRPLGSIRAYCLECCGNSPKEVRFCPLTDCPLWPFRFGSKPKAATRRLGKKGEDLLDASNFQEGAKFDPNQSVSELGA